MPGQKSTTTSDAPKNTRMMRPASWIVVAREAICRQRCRWGEFSERGSEPVRLCGPRVEGMRNRGMKRGTAPIYATVGLASLAVEKCFFAESEAKGEDTNKNDGKRCPRDRHEECHCDDHAPEADVERISHIAVGTIGHHFASHHAHAVYRGRPDTPHPRPETTQPWRQPTRPYDENNSCSGKETTPVRLSSRREPLPQRNTTPNMPCFNPWRPESKKMIAALISIRSRNSIALAPILPPRAGVYHSTLYARRRYSLRNAFIGSVFIAERAGIRMATKATSASNTVTAAKLSGSRGLTPNSTLRSTCDNTSAAASPTAPPMRASRKPSPRMRREMLRASRRVPCVFRSPASAARP